MLSQQPTIDNNNNQKEENKKIIRIAIIGSGIAGLALGVSFNQLNEKLTNFRIEHAIYERDVSFDSRAQGYALTIQANGFELLRKLGLEKKVRQQAQCIISANKTYSMVNGELKYMSGVEKKNKKRMNTPLPRQELRKIFLDEYLEKGGKIFWNKGLKHFREEHNDHQQPLVNVEFEDGEIQSFEILLGCDGLMSQVRREMKLDNDGQDSNAFGIGEGFGCATYTGVAMINGIANVTGDEQLRQMTFNTVFQVLDGHSRLFVKPFTKDQSMWLLTFPLQQGSSEIEHFKANILNEKSSLLEYAKEKVKHWMHPIPYFLEQTPVELMRGGLLHESTKLTSDTLPHTKFSNVTLLGDAMHAMAPFKGQGMNNALNDVQLLVELMEEQLLKSNSGGLDFPSLLKVFEPEMTKRAYKVQSKSRRLVNFLHHPDATDKEKHDTFYHIHQHQQL